MKIEIRIDENYKENKIIVEANKLTDEMSEVIETLKTIEQKKLKVFLDEEIYFVDEKDIEAIYSNDKKIYVKTSDKEYLSKNRLYELESILSKNDFIRISNSEIINLNKVKSINTKIMGSIVITFYSGYKTYSSRRYINKIKEILKI